MHMRRRRDGRELSLPGERRQTAYEIWARRSGHFSMPATALHRSESYLSRPVAPFNAAGSGPVRPHDTNPRAARRLPHTPGSLVSALVPKSSGRARSRQPLLAKVTKRVLCKTRLVDLIIRVFAAGTRFDGRLSSIALPWITPMRPGILNIEYPSPRRRPSSLETSLRSKFCPVWTGNLQISPRPALRAGRVSRASPGVSRTCNFSLPLRAVLARAVSQGSVARRAKRCRLNATEP